MGWQHDARKAGRKRKRILGTMKVVHRVANRSGARASILYVILHERVLASDAAEEVGKGI